MVNRNAARHLLLVVSILICFFVYMGYRLRGNAEATAESATLPTDSASRGNASSDTSSSLRPQTASSGAVGDNLDGWIPSARGDNLALTPPPGGSSVAVPSGLIPTASSSSPDAITGLIPSPPSDSSSSSIRPPSDSLPQFLPPPGAASTPISELGDLPPSLTPPGGSLKPPGGSQEEDPVSSITLPPFGGTATPLEPESRGMATSPSATAAAVRPPGNTGASQTAIASSSRPYQDAPAADAASRSTPSVTESRSASPIASRPVTGSSTQSASGQVRNYYDEDDEEEEYNDPVASESLRIYVVRPGDTLSNIAARELGSISLADNIFLLNRDVIEDPDHLLVGVKIRLPVREGYVPETTGSSGVVRRPTHGTGRSHTVVRGDTLSSIALQYYGTSTGWRFIYEANKTIVPNPNQLSVGTELSIPPYEDN